MHIFSFGVLMYHKSLHWFRPRIMWALLREDKFVLSFLSFHVTYSIVTSSHRCLFKGLMWLGGQIWMQELNCSALISALMLICCVAIRMFFQAD